MSRINEFDSEPIFAHGAPQTPLRWNARLRVDLDTVTEAVPYPHLDGAFTRITMRGYHFPINIAYADFVKLWRDDGR